MWSDLAVVGWVILGAALFAVWWTVKNFDTADGLRKWAEEMRNEQEDDNDNNVKERGQE